MELGRTRGGAGRLTALLRGEGPPPPELAAQKRAAERSLRALIEASGGGLFSGPLALRGLSEGASFQARSPFRNVLRSYRGMW